MSNSVCTRRASLSSEEMLRSTNGLKRRNNTNRVMRPKLRKFIIKNGAEPNTTPLLLKSNRTVATQSTGLSKIRLLLTTMLTSAPTKFLILKLVNLTTTSTCQSMEISTPSTKLSMDPSKTEDGLLHRCIKITFTPDSLIMVRATSTPPSLVISESSGKWSSARMFPSSLSK